MLPRLDPQRPQPPRSQLFSRHREARFILIVGLGAVGFTVAVDYTLTEGRIAAAFSQPVLYARSFFYPDALPSYGQVELTPMISIQIDPTTGAAQIRPEQTSTGPAPLKLDVIGAAADDVRNLAAPPPPSRTLGTSSPIPSAPGRPQ